MEDAAKAAADGVIDSLRQLLNALAVLVPGKVGIEVAKDAVDARSLPALGKALKRLWFDIALQPSQDWCEEKQAIWLGQLLLIGAGSREGLLSFFAAALLMCNSLMCFAKVLYPHAGMDPDEAWCESLAAVQTAVERDFQPELSRLPADHLGGSKRDALVSTNRLPALFRRMFDLEGHKLTPAQKGGLAVALVLPGTGIITAGGIGTALLFRKARQASRPEDEDPVERLFQRCQAEARAAIRRKENPVEVTYLPGSYGGGPGKLKICVHVRESLVPFGAVPLGNLGSDGVSAALVEQGETCQLRPKGDSNSLVLRVYRPALINEELLAVEIARGDKVVVVPGPNGSVKCYTRQTRPKAQPPEVSEEASGPVSLT